MKTGDIMNKEKKQKSSKLWIIPIIPLVIGIICIIIGIYTTSKAMKLPYFLDFGVTNSQKIKLKRTGTSFLLSGSFIAIIGTFICCLISAFIHNTKSDPVMIKSKTDTVTDSQQSNQTTVVKTHNKNATGLKDCIYCGSPSKIDATICESCGGKKFKKHKFCNSLWF